MGNLILAIVPLGSTVLRLRLLNIMREAYLLALRWLNASATGAFVCTSIMVGEQLFPMATAVARCPLEMLTVLDVVPRLLKKNSSISYAKVVVVTSVVVAEKRPNLTIVFLY